MKPDFVEVHNNLGTVLARKGDHAHAQKCYREAIRLKPDYSQAYGNLGLSLRDSGRLDEGIACLEEAIRLDPQSAEAWNNLGNTLARAGRLEDAVAALRHAIQIKPAYAEAHNNLGVIFRDAARPTEAIAACHRAIELKPDYVAAHSNLGNALKDAGEIDAAIASFRQSIRLDPSYVKGHSNLLYTIHFHPTYDAEMIFREHQLWDQQHARPLVKSISPHSNDRNPQRPLRIGYVSPDFREHPVGRFILPLLAAHDRKQFEVFCYSGVQRGDAMTEQARRHASHWRSTLGYSADQLAQNIRDDRIDILVDLTMHMAQNQMLCFARKPAPVQVTYLAYCSTTGLGTMDYRLTDPHLDPQGMNDAFYSEKSIRLPETYWCYPLDEQAPEVSPLPMAANGAVTFASLNNFGKVSADALDGWIHLLQAIPKSRLILHAHEGDHRQRVWDLLRQRGIDPNRLIFHASAPLGQYLKQYDQIDIGLDPFPCNGGTTTCDALWMGVPVVTLAGRTAVGRGGVSILSNLGLPELIAQTPQQYIQIASDLAMDAARLGELRRTLRQRMRASPLMNAPRFARNVELAYRQMWRDWCS